MKFSKTTALRFKKLKDNSPYLIHLYFHYLGNLFMSRISQKLVKHLNTIQNERIPFLVDVILRKSIDAECLPRHFEKSADFYKGLLAAAYAEMETFLSMHNLYNGYRSATVRDVEIRLYTLSFSSNFDRKSLAEIKSLCLYKYVSAVTIKAQNAGIEYKPESGVDYTIDQIENVVSTTDRPYIRVKNKHGEYVYLNTKTKIVNCAILAGAYFSFVCYTPDNVAVYDFVNAYKFQNLIVPGNDQEDFFKLVHS